MRARSMYRQRVNPPRRSLRGVSTRYAVHKNTIKELTGRDERGNFVGVSTLNHGPKRSRRGYAATSRSVAGYIVQPNWR
jgi:hypothetical protein